MTKVYSPSLFLNSDLVRAPFYFVIGFPISHSFSPKIHNKALAENKIAGTYVALQWAIEQEADFKKLIRHNNFRGANVTIPLKQRLLDWVDVVSEEVNSIGALNTIVPHFGQLEGENTDVYGFLKPLIQKKIPVGRAIVLGFGGAAKAVIYGLNSLGFKEIFVVSRNPKQSTANQAELISYHDVEELNASTDLIVNTTPVGMGDLSAKSPIQLSKIKCISSSTLIYDLIYNPFETELLRQAHLAGLRTLNGWPMFLHQAAKSFKMWTGTNFPFKYIDSEFKPSFL